MTLDMLTAADLLAQSAGAWRYTDMGLSPVALDLGFFQLRWYSLGYLVGIMIGYGIMIRLLKEPGAPMAHRHADDFILYATLGIIFGGRIGYILFYAPHLISTPVEMLKVWEGGMSFHGGAIGLALAAWLFVRPRGISFLRMCDYLACVVPPALFLVRLANFVNGELWGREADVAWAVIFPTGGEVARHPSQIYEALLEGVVMFAVLQWFFWRTDARYKPGFLAGAGAIVYGLSRIAVEFVRNPDPQLQWLVDATGLSMGQWLTMPMLLIGIGLVATAKRRRARVEPVAGADSVA